MAEMIDLERKITELAAEALPDKYLVSFLALPLKAKLIGLAVLAHIGDDPAVRAQMLKALSIYFKD